MSEFFKSRIIYTICPIISIISFLITPFLMFNDTTSIGLFSKNFPIRVEMNFMDRATSKVIIYFSFIWI